MMRLIVALALVIVSIGGIVAVDADKADALVYSCYGVMDKRPSLDVGNVYCDRGYGYVVAHASCRDRFGRVVGRTGTPVYRRASSWWETLAQVKCPLSNPEIVGLSWSTYGY